MLVRDTFVKWFTLFADCHNLYSTSNRMSEEEISKLGKAEQFKQCNLHRSAIISAMQHPMQLKQTPFYSVLQDLFTNVTNVKQKF